MYFILIITSLTINPGGKSRPAQRGVDVDCLVLRPSFARANGSLASFLPLAKRGEERQIQWHGVSVSTGMPCQMVFLLLLHFRYFEIQNMIVMIKKFGINLHFSNFFPR